jgi:hypothetical protein
MAGLDPAIHRFICKMDHRVTALRAGPVMTIEARALANYFSGGRSAKYSGWAFSTSAMKEGRN